MARRSESRRSRHTEHHFSTDDTGARLSLWRAACGAAVVFCLSCCVFWLTCRVVKVPPAWRTFEFCQYAEIGRNLVVDGRYDTRLVEPMALAFLDRVPRGARAARWPVVDRYPLPSLVVAAFMRILGPNDTAAAWSNGLAIGVLAALSYVLARCWFGAGWAAVVGIMFLTDPSFYGEFILLGTPDVWFATNFLLVLLLWSIRDQASHSRVRLGWALGLGLVSGLAYLARFNATLFLVVLGGALLWQRRWREAAVMAMTALLLVSPLFLYNWHHFRSPFVPLYSSWNLLDGIGGYRVEPWLYYRVPNLPAELWAHRAGLARKLATNLLTVVPLRIWNLWRLDLIMPLALLAPVFRRSERSAGRFGAWSVGFFALQLVVFSALRLELQDRVSPHHGRYFFWFAAPALLLGVGMLRRLRSRPGRFWWVAAVIVVAQLAIFGSGWRDIALRHSRETNLGHDPIRRALMRLVTDDRVIASNQPQITAWFCGLRSISLPADPSELAELNRVSATPADFLFVDTNFNCIDLDPRWHLLVSADPRMASPWETELLRDYEYVLPPDQTRPLLYVLLRRRVIYNKHPDSTGYVSFYGDKGALSLGEFGDYKIYNADDRLIEKRPDDAGGRNPWLAVDTFHTAHFIAAIRKGDHFGLSAQIEKGHRSTLLCHLGNIAYRTQRTLKCNPENGHVLDDETAMAFWQREYEPGWKPVV